MNQFLDFIYVLIVHPRAAMYTVTRGEKLRISCFVMVFTVLVHSLTSSSGVSSALMSFLVCLFLGLLYILFHSAVVHYISGLWGGRGSARGITAGLLCACFPYTFLVFAVLLDHTAGLRGLYGICFLAVFIWNCFLDVLAVRQNYGFSMAKSIIVIAIPFLTAAVVVILLFAIGVAAAVTGLSELNSLNGMDAFLRQM